MRYNKDLLKYVRPVLGIIAMILGMVTFLIPVLPFGYIFLLVGAVLLAPEIPVFEKFFKWLESKDRSKDQKLSKIRQRLYAFLEFNR